MTSEQEAELMGFAKKLAYRRACEAVKALQVANGGKAQDLTSQAIHLRAVKLLETNPGLEIRARIDVGKWILAQLP